MAGRFPGARNTSEFWKNLCDGVESISFFSDEDLERAGVDPAVLTDPRYVKAKGVLTDADLFDASFFGMNPREAELTDPQQRLFLECAWEALESSGYDPETYEGSIGVFGGASGLDTYLLGNLFTNRDLFAAAGYQIMIANDKDFLSTRVSYKLNLHGPSISVQTGCSTSLVAVAMAFQSLLNFQCDIALAGGVSVTVPLKSGYLHREGMILSPDGHCRAFDADGQGIVPGNGTGIVVLKRLEDAIADGDQIYAVVRGVAVNNDGSHKVGFTAPSVEGQSSAIAQALAFAEVEPDAISYIEAHGTGTPLGDPIEIAALTKAFRGGTDKNGFCAIGSVKTNVGHLDPAAGVAGFIKTVLALHHKRLPPSLNFNTPNPEIDFENTPFFVNTELAEWRGEAPLRAGVSSFGIGGTNAHIVLEEAPPLDPAGESRPWHLLVLSAKTPSALSAMTANFVDYLNQNPDANLADIAFTLQVGRRTFSHRWMLVACDPLDAALAVSTLGTRRVFTGVSTSAERSVVFMFSGQGSQYINMGRDLFESEPVFRDCVSRCAEILEPHLGLDIRHILYPADREPPEDLADKLKQTEITQPTLFVIEYALAQLWMKWGIAPSAMIGHSIGEYVAACIAGVLSLEDALALVAARGRLMQSMPGGAMLAVSLSETDLRPLLNADLTLAAVNGPQSCVVSGPREAIDELQDELDIQEIEFQRLVTSHAFHSAMMDPVLPLFAQLVKQINLGSPQIPYISNVTGTWITDAQTTSADYWAEHLRKPVLFDAGLKELIKDPSRILLELGPGRTLTTLAKQQPNKGSKHLVLSSMRHPYDRQSDVGFLLNAMGQLWISGGRINWPEFYAGERRRRVPLPTYPFERQRYWIDPIKTRIVPAETPDQSATKGDPPVRFSVPSWVRSPPPKPAQASRKRCHLIFEDEHGFGRQVAGLLEQRQHDVIRVRIGQQFAHLSSHTYAVNPRKGEDYSTLIRELRIQGKFPTSIVFFWGITPHGGAATLLDRMEDAQTLGFGSLVFLAQALGSQKITIDELQIGVITNGMQKVGDTPLLYPEKATVLGPCKVIPREYPGIMCFSVDIDLPEPNTPAEAKLVEKLGAELAGKWTEPVVAYRSGDRWVQTFATVRVDEPSFATSRVRQGGVYLITGGLKGIGLAIAEHLWKTARAKLILTTRSALPPKEEWDRWLRPSSPPTTRSALDVDHAVEWPQGSGSRDRDAVHLRIRAAHELEEMGSDFLVVTVNPATGEGMQAAISQGIERFGKINGVIHAAGHSAPGVIQRKALEVLTNVVAHKARGVLALDAAVKDIPLDFFAICSSLTSIVGEFRHVDYCGANAFLDAFAHYRSGHLGATTICINWDDRKRLSSASMRSGDVSETFVSTRTIAPAPSRKASLEQTTSDAPPDESACTFTRLLSSSHTQIIVSRQTVSAILEQNSKSIAPSLNDVEVDSIPRSVHPRPNLGIDFVAPRNGLENTIGTIWKKFFGIDQIGIHDDFFALGGDSLLAVQLVSKLRDVAKVDLPSHVLIGSPTIAGLSEIIASADSPSSISFSRRRPRQVLPPSLVRIKSGSAPRPLFLIHPVGGHVYVYRHLANCLGPEQSVFGLQARGLDGRADPFNAIEPMASYYLEAMRAVQPEGPYLLCGSSFGGVVAYEIAQQLSATGERAAMLAMLDSPNPRQVPEGMENSVERMAYLLSGDASISTKSEELQHLKPDEQLMHLLRKGGVVNRMFSSIALPQLQRFQQLVTLNWQALRSYTPRPYAGRVLFFEAEERDAFTIPSPHSGWADLALGGFVVHNVPGNHITMNLPPHVEVLVEKITPHLVEAQALSTG
jgi:acyl transferase domain-containing protein/thioesterase domain-containing protein/acyl carrier protein